MVESMKHTGVFFHLLLHLLISRAFWCVNKLGPFRTKSSGGCKAADMQNPWPLKSLLLIIAVTIIFPLFVFLPLRVIFFPGYSSSSLSAHLIFLVAHPYISLLIRQILIKLKNLFSYANALHKTTWLKILIFMLVNSLLHFLTQLANHNQVKYFIDYLKSLFVNGLYTL